MGIDWKGWASKSLLLVLTIDFLFFTIRAASSFELLTPLLLYIVSIFSEPIFQTGIDYLEIVLFMTVLATHTVQSYEYQRRGDAIILAMTFLLPLLLFLISGTFYAAAISAIAIFIGGLALYLICRDIYYAATTAAIHVSLVVLSLYLVTTLRGLSPIPELIAAILWAGYILRGHLSHETRPTEFDEDIVIALKEGIRSTDYFGYILLGSVSILLAIYMAPAYEMALFLLIKQTPGIAGIYTGFGVIYLYIYVVFTCVYFLSILRRVPYFIRSVEGNVYKAQKAAPSRIHGYLILPTLGSIASQLLQRGVYTFYSGSFGYAEIFFYTALFLAGFVGMLMSIPQLRTITDRIHSLSQFHGHVKYDDKIILASCFIFSINLLVIGGTQNFSWIWWVYYFLVYGLAAITVLPDLLQKYVSIPILGFCLLFVFLEFESPNRPHFAEVTHLLLTLTLISYCAVSLYEERNQHLSNSIGTEYIW